MSCVNSSSPSRYNSDPRSDEKFGNRELPITSVFALVLEGYSFIFLLYIYKKNSITVEKGGDVLNIFGKKKMHKFMIWMFLKRAHLYNCSNR